MNEFRRENRYLVIKRSDIRKTLTELESEVLFKIADKVDNVRTTVHERPSLECVVVEGDWPEFEPTWKAIENRMSGVVDQPTFDLVKHLYRQRAFSLKAFGPGMRTEAVVDHIRKELKEVLDVPQDLEEWIDLVLLSLDGAWRAGYTPEKIVAALTEKLTKNESRRWPDWRTADPCKAIEHVRELIDPDKEKDADNAARLMGFKP